MKMRILSIDGGGIRGILPGQILVALEEKLIEKSGNPNARIGDFFDLIAGTSTGAILGAAYICPDINGQPKFSAQEAVNFYLEDGDEIFDIKFWRSIGTLGGNTDEKYSANKLEIILKEAFLLVVFGAINIFASKYAKECHSATISSHASDIWTPPVLVLVEVVIFVGS